MDGVRGRQGDLVEGRYGKERQGKIDHRNGEADEEGRDRESKGEGTEGNNSQGKEASLCYWLKMLEFTGIETG